MLECHIIFVLIIVFFSGFPLQNPNQFVNQYNNISFPPPNMNQNIMQTNRVMSPPIQQNANQHRVVPIQVDVADFKGPLSQNPTVIQKYIIYNNIFNFKLNFFYINTKNALTYLLFFILNINAFH